MIWSDPYIRIFMLYLLVYSIQLRMLPFPTSVTILAGGIEPKACFSVVIFLESGRRGIDRQKEFSGGIDRCDDPDHSAMFRICHYRLLHRRARFTVHFQLGKGKPASKGLHSTLSRERKKNKDSNAE